MILYHCIFCNITLIIEIKIQGEEMVEFEKESENKESYSV